MKVDHFVALIFVICIDCAAMGGAPVVKADPEISTIDARKLTFSVVTNGQTHEFRIRPFVEVLINGLKANFEELEPGMKVKVTADTDNVASQITATGIRTRTTAQHSKTPLGASMSARSTRAIIPANSPDAYLIADIPKGSTISLQYVAGRWKDHGSNPNHSPDETQAEMPAMTENDRLVIALPSAEGKPGELVAIVPPGTKRKPFLFVTEKDYGGLVLRIHGDKSFSGNPGSVQYALKILPPKR